MVREPRSDDQIRGDVVEALIADERVDASAINVDVVGGTVYLTGVVPDAQHKQVSRGIAGRIKGVLDVVEDLGILG